MKKTQSSLLIIPRKTFDLSNQRESDKMKSIQITYL